MERQRDRNRGSHASSALHIKLQSAVDIRASSCLALFASCSKRGKIGAISAGRCVRVSGGFKFEMTETKLLRLGRV